MRNHLSLFFFFLFLSTSLYSQDLGETYLSEWRKIYPSKALSSGIRPYVFQYEEFSSERIKYWLDYNQQILIELASGEAMIDPIDGRLLRVQAQSKIDKWQLLSAHTTSLRLYSQLISKAIPSIFKADYILAPEKSRLLCNRLKAMEKLSLAAKANLKNVSNGNLERGITDIKKSIKFY